MATIGKVFLLVGVGVFITLGALFTGAIVEAAALWAAASRHEAAFLNGAVVATILVGICNWLFYGDRK